jgi:hypothetical protein
VILVTIIATIWAVLLVLVVGAIHVATSSPTPKAPARPSLVHSSDGVYDADLVSRAA